MRHHQILPLGLLPFTQLPTTTAHRYTDGVAGADTLSLQPCLGHVVTVEGTDNFLHLGARGI